MILILTIFIAVFLLVKFAVFDWFIRGCCDPYTYRVKERIDGWSFVQWKVFWWPFWFDVNNIRCTRMYFNGKKEAEKFVYENISKRNASKIKNVQYYSQNQSEQAAASTDVVDTRRI